MTDHLGSGCCPSLSLLEGAVIRAEELAGALVLVDEGWVAVTAQSAPEARRVILAVGRAGWLIAGSVVALWPDARERRRLAARVRPSEPAPQSASSAAA